MVGNEFSVVDREELIFHSICIDCIVPVSVGKKKKQENINEYIVSKMFG